MTPTFSFDVFLSHNRRDEPRVRRLAERLPRAAARHRPRRRFGPLYVAYGRTEDGDDRLYLSLGQLF